MLKKNSTLYINRELSWLNFNERVLLEADDPAVPVLERLSFLGIFSNNMDEFYRVRVAVLKRLAAMMYKNGGQGPLLSDDNPIKILKEIHHRTMLQRHKAEDIYENICRDLAGDNIFFINEHDLTEEQSVYVKQYFRDTVRQFLFPIMLDQFKNYSNLHDNSIYLVVDLTHKDNPVAENLALIGIPTDNISRLLVLPPNKPSDAAGTKRIDIMYLDDVIRHCLPALFSVYGFLKFTGYAVKFTRDAEFDISQDVNKSFLQSVSDGLKQRKFGGTVRFMYDEEMPKKVLASLREKFGIKRRDSLEKSGRYLTFRDLMAFPKNIGTKKKQYDSLPLIPCSDFSGAKERDTQYHDNRAMLDVIREKDVMLHYPYQSFQYIIDLLREASIDPAVRAIKMTIYRTAKHSAVVDALINAARNGKEVIVFVEFQARFDETANISWAAKMQEEGIRVLPSIPGMKVHCKLILIRRRERIASKDNQNVYYAAIGTGNPNENTAKIYCDEHLLTSNPDITAEVNKVFHILDDEKYQRPDFKELVVSPFGTRKFFLKKIDTEIRNAERGKPAWMVIKLNNLVDKKLVKRLYAASKAGVKVNLIVRGICVLVPGIRGQSENIHAVRIVDRFLEHSRILVFANGSKSGIDGGTETTAAEHPDFYIGSADWMERNLDRRFEVIVPIHDKQLQQELWDMLQIQLSDNVKARRISYDKPNERIPVPKGTKKVQSQEEVYRYLKAKVLSQGSV